MVLAAHRTPVRGRLVATTVETVRFTRPGRIDFRLHPRTRAVRGRAVPPDRHRGGDPAGLHRRARDRSVGGGRPLGGLRRRAVGADGESDVQVREGRSRAPRERVGVGKAAHRREMIPALSEVRRREDRAGRSRAGPLAVNTRLRQPRGETGHAVEARQPHGQDHGSGRRPASRSRSGPTRSRWWGTASSSRPSGAHTGSAVLAAPVVSPVHLPAVGLVTSITATRPSRRPKARRSSTGCRRSRPQGGAVPGERRDRRDSGFPATSGRQPSRSASVSSDSEPQATD